MLHSVLLFLIPPPATARLLLLMLLMLTACGSVASRDDAQHGLTGLWALQSVQQGNLRFELGGERPPFTLRLRPDGRAEGLVACNTWEGQARVGTNLIRLERTRASRSRCQIEDARIRALERRYLAVMEANSFYRLEGDTLTLQTTQAEEWTFERLNSD